MTLKGRRSVCKGCSCAYGKRVWGLLWTLKVVGWAVRVVAAFLTSGFEERIGVDFKGLRALGWPVKGVKLRPMSSPSKQLIFLSRSFGPP